MRIHTMKMTGLIMGCLALAAVSCVQSTAPEAVQGEVRSCLTQEDCTETGTSCVFDDANEGWCVSEADTDPELVCGTEDVPCGQGCLMRTDCEADEFCRVETHCEMDCVSDEGCTLVCTIRGTCIKGQENGCDANAACPPNSICENGVCVPVKIPVECRSDADCAKDQICDWSMCPMLNPCAPNTDCGTPPECIGQCVSPQEGCRSDADCPEGQVCAYSAMPVVCDECTGDAPCACTGQVSLGTCVPKWQEGCKGDWDCASGERCVKEKELNCGVCPDCTDDGICPPCAPCVDTDVGVCVVDPELVCQDDSNCPEGMGCVFTGACPACAPCFDASECPPCPDCPVMDHGFCVWTGPEPVPCKEDGDCQEGEQCRTLDSDPTIGFCETVPVDICYMDQDCGEGRHCEWYYTLNDCCMADNELCDYTWQSVCMGTCVPDDGCWSDADCPDGQVCNLPLTNWDCGGERCISSEGGTCMVE